MIPAFHRKRGESQRLLFSNSEFQIVYWPKAYVSVRVGTSQRPCSNGIVCVTLGLTRNIRSKEGRENHMRTVAESPKSDAPATNLVQRQATRKLKSV